MDDTRTPPATSTTAARWRSTLRVSPAELGRGTLHLLLDLPIGIAAFVLTLVLGVLWIGLLPVYPVALVVLVVWLAVVRGLAAFERGRVGALLGRRVPPPAGSEVDRGWHARLWRAVRDPATWRAVGYHLLRLPIGIVAFTATVVVWTLPLALVAIPFTTVLGIGELSSLLRAAPLFAFPVIGLLWLPLIPLTIRALTDLDAALAASLLGPSDRDRLDRRVEQLSSSRSEMVDIAEQERRRIERDLHDGAGQQLVSLAMTLGMAREKLEGDPASARALIDEAHTEAKQAIVGLRDIVRGISPAILTDRGLGAALSAVAARVSVPVTLVVDVPERPDPAIEGIAYFVVCEGIGNAVRHADASRIRVSITGSDDALHLEVSDDGRGGADASRGTGLRGLAGRVGAVDGTFEVASPAGGPTTIRAVLPARVGGASAEEG